MSATLECMTEKYAVKHTWICKTLLNPMVVGNRLDLVV